MKILLDECLPRDLIPFLKGHQAVMVSQQGWAGVKNGRLLALANQHFQVFLTIDKGIRFQQNFSGMELSTILVRAKSNRIEDLEPKVPGLLAVLSEIGKGEVVTV